MCRTVFLLVLLFLVPAASAEINDSIFDVLNETYFDGDWRVLSSSAVTQNRCEFSGQWYLITSVRTWTKGDDTYMRYGGYRWSGCRRAKYDSHWGSAEIHNYSEWGSKIFRPFCVTRRVWDAQPQYAKNTLNNTTKFMGVCPDGWDPHMGRPDDPPAIPITRGSDHVWGWVTIMFTNASMINGTMHVSDSSDVMPVFDVWHSVDRIPAYERCEACESCKDMTPTLISMTTNISVTDDADNVRATIDVVLIWGYHCWNCWPMGQPCRSMWRNTTETARFTATAKKPTIINESPINCTAHVTFHNYSRSPTAFIDVEAPKAIIKTTFAYNGSTVVRHDRIGRVLNDTYTIKFTNDTTIWYIDEDQRTISRRADSVVVKDRNFTLSKLNISIDTPYSRHHITNFSMCVIEHEKPRVGILTKTLLIFMVSVASIVMCVGVLRRSFF